MKKEIKVLQVNSSDEMGCCSPVGLLTLNRTQAEQAANVFAALADPTRLSILNLLAESQGEVCVCDITGSFTLGQPTISHHLKILRDAGLITGDKRGKWVYYSLVAGRTGEIKAMLDRVVKQPVYV